MKEAEEKKYYQLDKEQGSTKGPYTLSELGEQIAHDSSLANAPVSAEGAAQWSTARQTIDSKGASLHPAKKAPSLWAKIFGKRK